MPSACRDSRARLAAAANLLGAVSYRGVLARGFALVQGRGRPAAAARSRSRRGAAAPDRIRRRDGRGGRGGADAARGRRRPPSRRPWRRGPGGRGRTRTAKGRGRSSEGGAGGPAEVLGMRSPHALEGDGRRHFIPINREQKNNRRAIRSNSIAKNPLFSAGSEKILTRCESKRTGRITGR